MVNRFRAALARPFDQAPDSGIEDVPRRSGSFILRPGPMALRRALPSQRKTLRLREERPTAAEFLRHIHRELKARFYPGRHIKTYRHALSEFLRWLAAPPHLARREDIADYLQFIVANGAGPAKISIALAALRTSF